MRMSTGKEQNLDRENNVSIKEKKYIFNKTSCTAEECRLFF